jgi:hypothetical protein
MDGNGFRVHQIMGLFRLPDRQSSRIDSECATVLCCSMQLDKAIGFEARALEHWR